MLRIANSPLYASRRRIENLGQALTMLGLNATISLALGFTVTQGLTGGSGADHDLRQRAWKRSILSALAASQLGQARGLRRLEELMLAGLLQDLGVLCLAQAESERYLPCCAKRATTPTWSPASATNWAAATPTSAPGWPSNGACRATWWRASASARTRTPPDRRSRRACSCPAR